MQVSVVMCVRNGERTIRESIESALNQSFAELELVVVDDGSTDGTPEVIASLSDPRIKRLSFAQAGPAAARNRGIRESVGDLVAFLDADDLWHPRKLERQMEALGTDPAAAVAYCWVDRIELDGSGRKAHARGMHSGAVYERLLVTNFIGNGSNLLVRRSALEDVGLFHEPLEAAEDWELSVRLAARHRFVCVDEPLVLYRQTPGSISSDFRRLERSFHIALRKIFDEAPVEHRHLTKQATVSFYDYLSDKACREIRTRRQALTAMRWLLKAGLRYTPGEWKPWRRRAYLAGFSTAFGGLLGTNGQRSTPS